MKVNVAKSAGFCFGVKRAVETVYRESVHDHVYTYGPIIHNDEVVSDLEKQGVRVIHDISELSSIGEGTVIIRSHGVAKEIYEKIEAAGLRLVDATCPFVRKIHKIVERESGEGRKIIIFGNNK
jgi:4-hydroxy-3-methylbut-2-enyl diphosphate reductase